MMPIIFSLGPVSIYSFSIGILFSWCVFSFLFWKALKEEGITEERIFDYMFFGSVAAFLISRVGYVVGNISTFLQEPLKIVALWVSPGLSFYGGMLGGVLTGWYITRKYKMRFGVLADALALSLPTAFFVGSVGLLLDGTEVGRETSLPFAIAYIGHTGVRHPVQLYLMISLICMIVFLFFLQKIAKKRKWLPGNLGLGFIVLFSLAFFSIEFFKDTRVYWGNLSINQWISVALFCEGLGLILVKAGGRKALYTLLRKLPFSLFFRKKEERERQSTQPNP